MQDLLIRGLASDGKVKIAATRGPGRSWLGFAPQAGAFSGFQYLTPPLRASTEAKRKALEAAYTDIVTDDLPEWNQDPGLLSWLAGL